MPYKDPEKRKEYYKEWCERNKEKIKEKRKEYYEENKEKVLEKQKEYFKEYKQTPAYIKAYTISGWKRRGIKGDLEKYYEIKQNTTICNCCNKEFADSYDKCLDHDHDTGEFRQILCRGCNGFDNWNKN